MAIPTPWWKKTTNQMLAGLAVGTALGFVFGERMEAFRLLGDLFITLLQMAAIPLIFFNVITAIPMAAAHIMVIV